MPPQLRSLSKIFSMRNDTEKKIDEHVIDRMRKLFPGLKTTGMKDPARSAIMGAISNVGAYAFGAYSEPKVDGFKEETVNKNTIQYLKWYIPQGQIPHPMAMYRDWVNTSMEGALKITLKDAKDLIDSDILLQGKSDPYVVFTAGGSFVQSAPMYDTNHPVWNSTHYLFLRKRHLEPIRDTELTISCLDKDTREGFGSIINWIDGDDHLGSATLPVEELKKEGVQTFSLELVIKGHKNKKPSILNFSTEFISVETALKELNLDKDSEHWLERADLDDSKNSWPALTKKTDIGLVDVEKVAYIDARSTGTQAWVHANVKEKTVVVAFRGTEMARLKDIIADVRFIPLSLSSTMKADDYAMKATKQLLDRRIKVHGGFRDAYDAVRESVLRIVYDLTGWNDDWTIVITGHSLGGALATLCAFEFENRTLPVKQDIWKSTMQALHVTPQLPPIAPKVGMMNFGAPRVGTKPFVDLYNQTVSESLRVINANDLIHFLPPILYRHTKYEVLLQETGEVDIDGVDFQSGYSREIRDQIQSGKLKEEDLITKAFSRLSVLQHLGTHYLHLAEAAVEKFRERLMEAMDVEQENAKVAQTAGESSTAAAQ